MFTIIATCTSTRTVEPVVKVGDLPTNLTAAEAIKLWVEKLDTNAASTTPRDMYRGLGFLTLSNILRQFPCDARIVTGGQGLIGVDEPIVPYDFTADQKQSPNIWEKVTKEPFSQTAWWRMINEARGKGPTPIADLINKSATESSIIISCPKIFLRYIVADILSVQPDKVKNFRILLSASSLGSIPVQLRPFIVSFDRGSVKNLPGNRNDVTHRAAYMFVEALTNKPELRLLPPHVQREAIFPIEGAGIYASSTLDPATLLKSRPDLLELSPEDAYSAIYRQHGPIGGRLRFKGIFLSLKGQTHQTQDTEVDDDAVEAFNMLNLNAPTQQSQAQDDRSLDILGVMMATLRQHAPKAEFTSSDVSNWVNTYCAKKQLDIPPSISSPLKVVYFLKAYASVLQVAPSGKNFKLAT